MNDDKPSGFNFPSGHFGRPTPLLTRRERQALDIIARGFSYAEAAQLQLISINTIRTHLKNIYSKLGVHSKTEAVYEATALGLLEPAQRTLLYHADRRSTHVISADHFESGARAAGFFHRA